MAWSFDPSNWAGTNHAPTYQDFINIQSDLHAPGGDVVYGGNYVRTCGSVQLQAGDVPGTAYTISAGSWASTTATVTVGTHHAVVGQLITVASVTPTGYNVSLVPVTAVTGTTISYTVSSNPGAYTSGGTLTVGQAPQAGMIAVDGSGVLKRYFSGAWASITAASQTPWSQDIDGGGFKLTNLTSITLTPAAVPTGAAGRLAVDASDKLRIYDGSTWQFTGLQDPAGNGLVKRTALNTTTAAAAGTDYYAPGGVIARADLPVMVASGGSHAVGVVPDPGASAGTTKFLREDGTWAIPASSGLNDPGSNGLVKRTAVNTTVAASVGVDYYAPGNAVSVTDIRTMGASGAGHSTGLVPDPGAVATVTKFLREDGTWAVPVITALQGIPISGTAPLDTQVLAYNAGINQWEPTAAGGGGANATQLQGRNIDSTAPTDTQVLAWNAGSSKWAPTTTNTATGACLSNAYLASGSISIPTVTAVALTFDTNIADIGGVHSTVTNTSRFTIPTGQGGTYLISAGIRWSPTGSPTNSQVLELSLKKNGATFLFAGSIPSGNTNYNTTLTAYATLSAGDYIEAYAFQNTGSTLTAIAGAGETFCQIIRLI